MVAFNISYNKVHTCRVAFETKVNERALGGEQRYPVKIYPVRYFTLTFNKNQVDREALLAFYASVYGAGGTFSFTWATNKGGNGKTYTNCSFESDTFKQSIVELGYGEGMELTFYCIDRNSYTAPTDFDFYHKAKYDIETEFNTIIDKVITAQSTKRTLWNTPKKRWLLKFEKTRANRELIEAYFIAKRGKFKSFEWVWEAEKGGDGETYDVRFDIDDLDFKILELGYSYFEIPIKEVMPLVTSDELEKDEIIPRKLFELVLDTGSVRILENDTLESLSYLGDNYLGAPITLGNISQDDNSEVVKIDVSISNVGQGISGIIGTSGDIITGARVNLYLVFLNTSTGAIISGEEQYVLYGKANNVELNIEEAKLTIDIDLGGYEMQIPRMKYGVNCQWIKFKDIKCGYTGAQTTCDRTLSTCKRYGNIENFGGFPNLPKEKVIKA